MEASLADKVGLTFKPFRFAVERGKIREFALAIGDDNPIYHDREAAQKAGYRDIPVPPTFSTVIEMWAGADFEELIEKLDMDPLKVLHGEQEYCYEQDICAGDEISGQTRVTRATTRRSMTMVELETRFTNQLGETVLIARSLLIERP